MKKLDKLYSIAQRLRDQFNKNIAAGQDYYDETNVLLWRAFSEIVSFLHATEGEIVNYGYSSGTYMSRCVHCGTQSLADKRATSCWFCAKLEERKRNLE